jgi:hypothetical protein
MQAGRYNISVTAGTTFQLSPQWLINNSAVNLTGYSATFQVRQFVDSVTPLLNATTSNGLITITGATGTININVPSTTTSSWAAGNYQYALNLTAPDGVTTTQLLQGSFTVSASAVH